MDGSDWEQDLKRLNSCQQFFVCINGLSLVGMAIVQFAMLIWGSVVVFGAWATWTDDFEKYKNNVDELNYCKYDPMTFAFSLLLIKWVIQ